MMKVGRRLIDYELLHGKNEIIYLEEEKSTTEDRHYYLEIDTTKTLLSFVVAVLYIYIHIYIYMYIYVCACVCVLCIKSRAISKEVKCLCCVPAVGSAMSTDCLSKLEHIYNKSSCKAGPL
jgi:hypothetical protein